MRRFVLPAVALLLLPASAMAQSIGEALPGRNDPLARPSKPVADKPAAARPCPEYGAGFVRVEGSTFCVRLGGGVRVEVGKTSGVRGVGRAAEGMVYLEGRGQTGLGEVRSVLQMRGRIDRNLGASSYPYYY